MTIDEALKQLKSEDPELRRQAVIAIGKTRNPSALRVLADVYKSDPDPDVRELALKAGKYIRANLTPASSVEPSTPAPVGPVSDVNRERAAAYQSQALDYQLKGNILKAAETLGHAFDLNPELANDSLAKNLASDVTGQEPALAVRTFLDRNARAQFIASKGGRAVPSSDESGDSATSWGSAILDLTIYGVAVGAYVFIVLMIGSQAVLRMMEQVASANGQSLPTAFITALQNGATVGVALPVALVAAVISFVALLFESAIIHLVAKTAQGGVGLLASMVHKLAFLAIVFIPVSAAIGLPALLIADRNVQSILNSVSLLASVVFWYFVSRQIGRNYSFSTGKGCVTLLLSAIVMVVLAVCCAFTLSLALAGFINSAPGAGV